MTFEKIHQREKYNQQEKIQEITTHKLMKTLYKHSFKYLKKMHTSGI